MKLSRYADRAPEQMKQDGMEYCRYCGTHISEKHDPRCVVVDSLNGRMVREPLYVEFSQRGCCLFDGHQGVRPVHLIDIDVVRFEATQRILKLMENALARGVAFDFAIRPIESDLCGKDNALSTTTLAEGFAHNLFGAPTPVNGRRVDQVDALVKRSMNGANGFLLVASAPHPAADGPGAKCDSGTNEICTVDLDVFQHGFLHLVWSRIVILLVKPVRVKGSAVEIDAESHPPIAVVV